MFPHDIRNTLTAGDDAPDVELAFLAMAAEQGISVTRGIYGSMTSTGVDAVQLKNFEYSSLTPYAVVVDGVWYDSRDFISEEMTARQFARQILTQEPNPAELDAERAALER